MKYPLNILKEHLEKAEDAEQRCLKNDNKSEYNLINKEKTMPLKNAIWLIELATEDKLLTELFNSRKGYLQ